MALLLLPLLLLVLGTAHLADPATSCGAPATAKTITKLPTHRRVVALTFDGGADTGYAERILDTLAAYRVKATFAVTGQWAEKNPALTRRIRSAGHAFINHTYSHRSFTGVSTGTRPLDYSSRKWELEQGECKLRSIAGVRVKPYFRPPYGDDDPSVNADLLARNGYRYNVQWTVGTRGWTGVSAPKIVARSLRALEPGAIYLFHLGASSRDALALPRVISVFRKRGYRFTTISRYYH